MPRQDARGRWVSDDGAQYWDGTAWRPVGTVAPRQGRSVALPAVLIGCGFALIIAIVVVIGGVFLVTSSTFQHDFRDSWNNDPQQTGTPCPFHPSP